MSDARGVRRGQATHGEAMDDAVPRLRLAHADPPPDLLAGLFHRLAALVLQHPVAAQALFAALVAEGRRFAQTPEGARWRLALANSELVRRGRALWEESALNVLEDDPRAVFPSAIFDAIARAAGAGELNRLWQRATSVEDERGGAA